MTTAVPVQARPAAPPIRVLCICVVKNEADIVAQCLEDAARWAWRIFVYDNGSTDGTWEAALNVAARNERVVPFRQDGKPFHPTMRQEVFSNYRDLADDGDWWCILDADEFYREDPRKFLARIPAAYQAAWNVHLDFFLTEQDIARYERDPALYGDDVPVAEKIRYYRAGASELRFFRHDRSLAWPPSQRSPLFGALYPERVPTLHYRQRSPQQLQSRIDVRKEARSRGTPTFRHETVLPDTWRERIADIARDGLHLDTGEGNFVIDEAALRPLPFQTRLPPRLVNILRPLKTLARRVIDRRQVK